MDIAAFFKFLPALAILILGVVVQVRWFKERKEILRTQRNPHPEDWVNSWEALYLSICILTSILWMIIFL